jgi:hypothetical protein
MDIVQKIRPLKATYESFGIFSKIIISIVLISLLSIIVPHDAYAEEEFTVSGSMVFEAGDHLQFLEEMADDASFQLRHETAVAKLQRQLKMNDALKSYLEQKRSPLAPYSATLLQQNNWKKIVALSNAESSLCKKYIEATANCWGVGGSDLWDMGENLGEGVVEMNKFLNNAPSRSPIKYSQMNFYQMNGLYKQPARDHWVYNNLEIYNELVALEKNL